MVARVRTVAFHGVEVIEVDTQVTIASTINIDVYDGLGILRQRATQEPPKLLI
jgi:hypothetical protein